MPIDFWVNQPQVESPGVIRVATSNSYFHTHWKRAIHELELLELKKIESTGIKVTESNKATLLSELSALLCWIKQNDSAPGSEIEQRQLEGVMSWITTYINKPGDEGYLG